MPAPLSRPSALAQAQTALQMGSLGPAARLLIQANLAQLPLSASDRADFARLTGELLSAASHEDTADLAFELAQHPDDTRLQLALGRALLADTLAGIALAFLAPAAAHHPSDVEVWLSWLTALDTVGEHTHAVASLEANPELVRHAPAIRAMRAHHRLLTGDFDGAFADFDQLDNLAHPVTAAIHQRLTQVFDRIRAICPPYPLHNADLTGWHMALNGAFLLHASPLDPETFHGRYTHAQLDLPTLSAVLSQASHLLTHAQIPLVCVRHAPDRDSLIAALALATLLKLPVRPLDLSDDSGIAVVWDLDRLPAPLATHLAQHRPNAPLFALGVRWIDRPVFAPDLTGWLHQSCVAPWQAHGDRPADTRDPKTIAQAWVQTAPAATRSPGLEEMLEALGGLSGASQPGLRRAQGQRPLLFEGAPVRSYRVW